MSYDERDSEIRGREKESEKESFPCLRDAHTLTTGRQKWILAGSLDFLLIIWLS